MLLTVRNARITKQQQQQQNVGWVGGTFRQQGQERLDVLWLCRRQAGCSCGLWCAESMITSGIGSAVPYTLQNPDALLSLSGKRPSTSLTEKTPSVPRIPTTEPLPSATNGAWGDESSVPCVFMGEAWPSGVRCWGRGGVSRKSWPGGQTTDALSAPAVGVGWIFSQ